MDKKLLKQYLNRTGFQDGTTMDLKYINPGFDKSEGMASGMGGFPIVPAAGIGAVLALNKKRGIGDNNPPSPIKEDKTPQQEPPEDKEPDIISELATGEILKESEDKIKNKITTWEDYFPTIEEATKAAKDVGGTLKEFEEDLIEKKITFRKTGDGLGFEIYFDKKFVGELSEVDPYKEDPTRRGNQKSYSLRYIDEDGHPGEAFTTIDGQKFAKEKTKELVARDLLRKDDEGTRLRDIFQNLEYNKKGEPKAAAEAVEEIRKLIEKNKEKKAYGGLIDKPLTGRSRDI